MTRFKRALLAVLLALGIVSAGILSTDDGRAWAAFQLTELANLAQAVHNGYASFTPTGGATFASITSTGTISFATISTSGAADIGTNADIGGYITNNDSGEQVIVRDGLQLYNGLSRYGSARLHIGPSTIQSIVSGAISAFSLASTSTADFYGDVHVTGTISDHDTAVTLADLTVIGNSVLNGSSNVFYGTNTIATAAITNATVSRKAENLGCKQRWNVAAAAGHAAPFSRYHLLPPTCYADEFAYGRTLATDPTLLLYACATTNTWVAIGP